MGGVLSSFILALKLLRRFYEPTKPVDSVLGVQGRFRRCANEQSFTAAAAALSVMKSHNNRNSHRLPRGRFALKRSRGKPPFAEHVILAKDTLIKSLN